MNLMLDVTFPAYKSDDVGQAFVEILQSNPMPEYVKLKDYYQAWGADGILGHVIYELDDANFRDAARWVTNVTWQMTKKVESWRVLNQDIVVTFAEAYEYLGTQAPSV